MAVGCRPHSNLNIWLGNTRFKSRSCTVGLVKNMHRSCIQYLTVILVRVISFPFTNRDDDGWTHGSSCPSRDCIPSVAWPSCAQRDEEISEASSSTRNCFHSQGLMRCTRQQRQSVSTESITTRPNFRAHENLSKHTPCALF